MTTYMEESSTIFKASFPGKCNNCGETIEVGDQVRFIETKLVRLNCCVIKAESSGIDFDAFNHGREPGIAVMPLGKTKEDMCNRCFQIPSNNGSCGCDS